MTEIKTTPADEFYFPSRFDEDLADEGRWIDIVDENDNRWGDFKCMLVDTTLPRYKTMLTRLQKRFKTEKPKDDFAAILLVEGSIIDWRLYDAKGKQLDIPFTKEAALRYLSNPKAQFVVRELAREVENVKNFQRDDEETAKN